MKSNFEIIQLKKNKINLEFLKVIVEHIYEKENIDRNEILNIILTDNEHLQELNRKFKGVNRATDVLSFSFKEEDVGIEPMLGEVYISIDKAEEQAEKYGVSLQNEVERLMVHGILHLVGWEHQESDEAERMFKKTESYLSLVRKNKE